MQFSTRERESCGENDYKPIRYLFDLDNQQRLLRILRVWNEERKRVWNRMSNRCRMEQNSYVMTRFTADEGFSVAG